MRADNHKNYNRRCRTRQFKAIIVYRNSNSDQSFHVFLMLITMVEKSVLSITWLTYSPLDM